MAMPKIVIKFPCDPASECATQAQATTIIALLERLVSEAEQIRENMRQAMESLAEVAEDVKTLVAKLADGGLTKVETAEVVEKTAALAAGLAEAKAIYDPPATPPVDPPL